MLSPLYQDASCPIQFEGIAGIQGLCISVLVRAPRSNPSFLEHQVPGHALSFCVIASEPAVPETSLSKQSVDIIRRCIGGRDMHMDSRQTVVQSVARNNICPDSFSAMLAMQAIDLVVGHPFLRCLSDALLFQQRIQSRSAAIPLSPTSELGRRTLSLTEMPRSDESPVCPLSGNTAAAVSNRPFTRARYLIRNYTGMTLWYGQWNTEQCSLLRHSQTVSYMWSAPSQVIGQARFMHVRVANLGSWVLDDEKTLDGSLWSSRFLIDLAGLSSQSETNSNSSAHQQFVRDKRFVQEVMAPCVNSDGTLSVTTLFVHVASPSVISEAMHVSIFPCCRVLNKLPFPLRIAVSRACLRPHSPVIDSSMDEPWVRVDLPAGESLHVALWKSLELATLDQSAAQPIPTCTAVALLNGSDVHISLYSHQLTATCPTPQPSHVFKPEISQCKIVTVPAAEAHAAYAAVLRSLHDPWLAECDFFGYASGVPLLSTSAFLTKISTTPARVLSGCAAPVVILHPLGSVRSHIAKCALLSSAEISSVSNYADRLASASELRTLMLRYYAATPIVASVPAGSPAAASIDYAMPLHTHHRFWIPPPDNSFSRHGLVANLELAWSGCPGLAAPLPSDPVLGCGSWSYLPLQLEPAPAGDRTPARILFRLGCSNAASWPYDQSNFSPSSVHFASDDVLTDSVDPILEILPPLSITNRTDVELEFCFFDKVGVVPSSFHPAAGRVDPGSRFEVLRVPAVGSLMLRSGAAERSEHAHLRLQLWSRVSEVSSSTNQAAIDASQPMSPVLNVSFVQSARSSNAVYRTTTTTNREEVFMTWAAPTADISHPSSSDWDWWVCHRLIIQTRVTQPSTGDDILYREVQVAPTLTVRNRTDRFLLLLSVCLVPHINGTEWIPAGSSESALGCSFESAFECMHLACIAPGQEVPMETALLPLVFACPQSLRDNVFPPSTERCLQLMSTFRLVCSDRRFDSGRIHRSSVPESLADAFKSATGISLSNAEGRKMLSSCCYSEASGRCLPSMLHYAMISGAWTPSDAAGGFAVSCNIVEFVDAEPRVLLENRLPWVIGVIPWFDDQDARPTASPHSDRPASACSDVGKDVRRDA